MLSSRPQGPYKAVETLLKSPLISDSKKSYAQGFIDGTITIDDLRPINSAQFFKTNHLGQLDASEPKYNSLEAMQELIEKISPYLSKRNLYQLVEKLVAIEVTGSNLAAFRNSTLAKYFYRHETARNITPENPIPETFLSHFRHHVYDLVSQNWGGTGAVASLNTFADFNLGMKTPSAQAIMDFDVKAFNPASLSDQAQKSEAEKSAFLSLYQVDMKEEKMTPPASPDRKSSELNEENTVVSKPTHFRQTTSDSMRLYQSTANQLRSGFNNELENHRRQMESAKTSQLELQKQVEASMARLINELKPDTEEYTKAQKELEKLMLSCNRMGQHIRELEIGMKKFQDTKDPLDEKLKPAP